MQIRREQVAALERQARTRFVRETADHLRIGFPAHPLTQDEGALERFIETGIDTAGTHGIGYDYDVRRFLELELEYGPNFPQALWAARILARPGLSGTARMDALDDYTVYTLRGA